MESSCRDCIHAVWNKTVNGRRHPSGNGRCTAVPVVNLPKAFYFVGSSKPAGGHIDWKSPEKEIDCMFWETGPEVK